MTTKIETRTARKCVECYMESIYRIITGYRVKRGWVQGLPDNQAAELKIEALRQIAEWGDASKTETRNHNRHVGRRAS